MDEWELHHIVYDDALAAWSEMQADDSQRRRRAYVRTAFAAIEALTFLLKQEALLSAEGDASLYTLGEVAMLREESYAIAGSGVSVAPKYASTPDNFRFAVNMMMRAILRGFTLHVGVKGWDDLKKAAALRNRLVHPKSAHEMTVSDTELETVQNAFFWVNDATVQALANAVDVLASKVGEPVSPEIASIRDRWKAMRAQRGAT